MEEQKLKQEMFVEEAKVNLEKLEIDEETPNSEIFKEEEEKPNPEKLKQEKDNLDQKIQRKVNNCSCGKAIAEYICLEESCP